MIQRTSILHTLTSALSRSRIVVLTGPRRCGKTTLARILLSEDSVKYFDLEDPSSLGRLDEPMTALRPLTGLVVIDEVQRRPDLFRVLRVPADREKNPARFMILGSASGNLLHQLLGINSLKDLLTHPKVGASWEGFVIDQVLMTEPHDEAFFWATHQGAEIDLILRCGNDLLGLECKRTDSPRLTPSIRNALVDLKLKRVIVLYPGTKRFPLGNRVEAVPLLEIAKGVSIFGNG